jgi:Protein of unknown function (DUF2510)
MAGQALPAPGWYPDPSGAPRLRYFDGSVWADYYAPSASQQMSDAAFAVEPGLVVDYPTIPEYSLYSLNQITLAAFLGGPFPGFWLASQDLNTLARNRLSRQCLAWAAVLTLANLALAFIVPEEFPALIIALPFIVATRLMAKRWLGPELAAHEAAGGQLGSWWITVFAGVIGLVAIFAIILVAIVIWEIFWTLPGADGGI